MSAYIWSEKESRKTKALRRKDERQSQAKEADLFEDTLSKGIEPPPFAPVFAETEQRLDIREGCAGLIIGKKGENIRNVEQRFRVTIRIEDLNPDAKSILKGRRDGPQQVVISGLSPDAVDAATRELDVVSETMDVPAFMANWLVGRQGKHLKLIKELSGLPVLSLRRPGAEEKGAGAAEEEGEVAAAIREALGEEHEDGRKENKRKTRGRGEGNDEEGGEAAEAADDAAADAEGEEDGADQAAEEDAGDGRQDQHCWLELKGRRDRVADARLLFETHMGYYPVYEEMNEAERELDREIAEAQGQLRRGGRGGRGGRTNGGGRGAGGGVNGGEGEVDGTLSGGAGRGRGRGRGRGGRTGDAAAPGPSAEEGSAGGRGPGRGRGAKGRGR